MLLQLGSAASFEAMTSISEFCQGFLTSRNLKYSLPTADVTDSCTPKVLSETDSLNHEENGKQMLANEVNYSISHRGWPCTQALT